MQRIFILRYVCSLLLIVGSLFGASAQDSLHFSSVEGSIHMDIGYEILSRAYQELGYKISRNDLPGRTAIEKSSSGELDGELLRIDGISLSYPDLVQVSVPVAFFQGVAYSSKYFFPVNNWYSLEPYKIGIVKGAMYAEIGTQGMNVTTAENAEQLFQMLANQEIDVAITSKLVGQLLKKPYPDIRELEGILETMFLYHYLSQKERASH